MAAGRESGSYRTAEANQWRTTTEELRELESRAIMTQYIARLEEHNARLMRENASLRQQNVALREKLARLGPETEVAATRLLKDISKVSASIMRLKNIVTPSGLSAHPIHPPQPVLGREAYSAQCASSTYLPALAASSYQPAVQVVEHHVQDPPPATHNTHCSAPSVFPQDPRYTANPSCSDSFSRHSNHESTTFSWPAHPSTAASVVEVDPAASANASSPLSRGSISYGEVAHYNRLPVIYEVDGYAEHANRTHTRLSGPGCPPVAAIPQAGPASLATVRSEQAQKSDAQTRQLSPHERDPDSATSRYGRSTRSQAQIDDQVAEEETTDDRHLRSESGYRRRLDVNSLCS